MDTSKFLIIVTTFLGFFTFNNVFAEPPREIVTNRGVEVIETPTPYYYYYNYPPVYNQYPPPFVNSQPPNPNIPADYSSFNPYYETNNPYKPTPTTNYVPVGEKWLPDNNGKVPNHAIVDQYDGITPLYTCAVDYQGEFKYGELVPNEGCYVQNNEHMIRFEDYEVLTVSP